jgi:hypothetical protein
VKYKITNIILFILFTIGVISNSFAFCHVHETSKKSIEEGAERQEGIKAWELMTTAIGNAGTAFGRDVKSLQKIADYISEIPAPGQLRKIDAIGGEEGLYNFISKNTDVPCTTCGNGGLPVFAGRNMDEMLENYIEVGHIYRNHQDLWSKLSSGANHPLGAMREGTQHTLETIRLNPSKYAPENIHSMDLRFENLPEGIDLCTNCRYDIKFRPNNETVLQEFKSYALSTWNGIKSDSKFLQQFRDYLASGDVATISDFQYVINTRKASVDQVKVAFKELFMEKKPEIFLSMNSNLKESLEIDDISDLTSSKIDEILDVIVKNF